MYKKFIIPTILLLAVLGGVIFLRPRLMSFDYSLQPVVTLAGVNVSPNEFLASHIYGITAEFADTRNFAPGRHDVALQLNNGSRNQRATGVLYVITPVEYIELEFAQPPRNFVPLDFIENAEIIQNIDVDLQFLQEPSHSPPIGETDVHIVLNGATTRSAINVVDTTPPTADIVHREVPKGDLLIASDFLENVFDASPIILLDFVTPPGDLIVGQHTLSVIVKD